MVSIQRFRFIGFQSSLQCQILVTMILKERRKVSNLCYQYMTPQKSTYPGLYCLCAIDIFIWWIITRTPNINNYCRFSLNHLINFICPGSSVNVAIICPPTLGTRVAFEYKGYQSLKYPYSSIKSLFSLIERTTFLAYPWSITTQPLQSDVSRAL